MLLAMGCAETTEKLRPVPKGAEGANKAAKAKPPEAKTPPLSVSAPAWQRGDEWIYTDGYGLRVTGINGNVTIFQRIDDPKQWFSRFGFLREEAQSRDAFRKVVYRSIPPARGLQLTAGAPLVFTREFLSDDQLRVHSTSWVVEGRETITVPAGEFDCLVIVMRTRSQNSGWTGFERWWYSPKVRHYVRMEYKYGGRKLSSRVLVSYVTMN
jgi:hypothetical protein